MKTIKLILGNITFEGNTAIVHKIDATDLKFLDSFVGQFYPSEILNELKNNGFNSL